MSSNLPTDIPRLFTAGTLIYKCIVTNLQNAYTQDFQRIELLHGYLILQKLAWHKIFLKV